MLQKDLTFCIQKDKMIILYFIYNTKGYKIMSKVVKIKNVKFGEGMPKIAIPISDSDYPGVRKSATFIMNSPCDLIEWRADFYNDVQNPESRIKPMTLFHDTLWNLPLLFTVRTSVEGGMLEIDTDDYESLLTEVIDSGLIDMVDVELSRGDGVFKRLVAKAHEAGVKVVGSRHNFKSTPDIDILVRTMCKMQDLGADFAKYAVTPRNERDVLNLLDATLQMKEEHNDTPVITMSMGHLGVVSRICGEVFGSCITFGTAGKASAPGQLPANGLSIFLKSLS